MSLRPTVHKKSVQGIAGVLCRELSYYNVIHKI